MKKNELKIMREGRNIILGITNENSTNELLYIKSKDKKNIISSEKQVLYNRGVMSVVCMTANHDGMTQEYDNRGA